MAGMDRAKGLSWCDKSLAMLTSLCMVFAVASSHLNLAPRARWFKETVVCICSGGACMVADWAVGFGMQYVVFLSKECLSSRLVCWLVLARVICLFVLARLVCAFVRAKLACFLVLARLAQL